MNAQCVNKFVVHAIFVKRLKMPEIKSSVIKWQPAGVCLLVAALAACQPQPKEQVSAPPPELRKHPHAEVYQIAGAQSSIKLKVYRDGPLARFGHNHAIAIEQISGTVYREKTLAQSELEFSFPVVAMAVDRSADRAELGPDFASTVSPEAIAGTRENMLGPKLLAAQQYPQIALRSIAISGELPDLSMVIAVKLRALETQLIVPVHVSEQNGVLIADGNVHLSQAQLGLTPYSVLGGGLRVSDAVDAQFHLVALRTPQK
jgi:hypothetical protein